MAQVKNIELARKEMFTPESELLEAQFSLEVTEDRIRVTMLAQCREDIGMEREIGA